MRKKTDPEVKAKMDEMIRNGVECNDIAKALPLSYQTIYSRMKVIKKNNKISAPVAEEVTQQ
jgi:hypothetical protein